MSPRTDFIHPLSQFVPCYGADAIGPLLEGVTWPLMIGAAAACFAGALFGQAIWYGLHTLILRRLRPWRRFQTSMVKVFERDAKRERAGR